MMSVVLLNVIMLSVIVLNTIMLSVIIMNAAVPCVVILSVIMLKVEAPSGQQLVILISLLIGCHPFELVTQKKFSFLFSVSDTSKTFYTRN